MHRVSWSKSELGCNCTSGSAESLVLRRGILFDQFVYLPVPHVLAANVCILKLCAMLRLATFLPFFPVVNQPVNDDKIND
jgi:hypothetical protein